MTRRDRVIEAEVWPSFRKVSVTLRPVEPGYGERSAYDVLWDGETIGRVFRREFTRERRPYRGAPYVSRRWTSWGWTYSTPRGRGYERDTRRDAVSAVLSEHLREAQS